MTKIFNFIIFLVIVYSFFYITSKQFENFTGLDKKSKKESDQILEQKYDKISEKESDQISEKESDKILDQESDYEINASEIISDTEDIELIKQNKPIKEKKKLSSKSCGIGIGSRRNKGDLFCDSKTVDNWKLNKPTSEILEKISKCTSEGIPIAIKDIYNKVVEPLERSAKNIRAQGEYTMDTNSNKWTTLKGHDKTTTKLTKSLHANDPNFDSYSKF